MNGWITLRTCTTIEIGESGEAVSFIIYDTISKVQSYQAVITTA